MVSDAEDFHALDSDAFERFNDFGPDVAMVFLIFGDDFGIVFKVKSLSEGFQFGFPAERVSLLARSIFWRQSNRYYVSVSGAGKECIAVDSRFSFASRASRGTVG